MESFDAVRFAEALNSEGGILDNGRKPVVVMGFVKPGSQGQSLLLFAPENDSLNWIPIPTALIEKVVHHGKKPCFGSVYDFVSISLRFPDTAEGSAIQSLLRSATSVCAVPPGGSSYDVSARGNWSCNAWYWLSDESFTRYYNFVVVANTLNEATSTADWTMRSWLNSTWGDRWSRYHVNVSHALTIDTGDRPGALCKCHNKDVDADPPFQKRLAHVAWEEVQPTHNRHRRDAGDVLATVSYPSLNSVLGAVQDCLNDASLISLVTGVFVTYEGSPEAAESAMEAVFVPAFKQCLVVKGVGFAEHIQVTLQLQNVTKGNWHRIVGVDSLAVSG